MLYVELWRRQEILCISKQILSVFFSYLFAHDSDMKEPNPNMMPFNPIAKVMRNYCDMYMFSAFFSLKGKYLLSAETMLVCEAHFIPVNLPLLHIETSLQSENLMTHSVSVF